MASKGSNGKRQERVTTANVKGNDGSERGMARVAAAVAAAAAVMVPFAALRGGSNNLLPTAYVELAEDFFASYLQGHKRWAPEDPAWAVPDWMQVAGRVDMVEFSELTHIDERRPMIIKNSPVASWEAIGKWNPAYIESKVAEFKRVRMTRDRNPLFMYEDERLLMRKWDKDGEVIPLTNYERQNMTSRAFFKAPRPMYFSHLFQTFLKEPLDADVSPRLFMYVVDDEANKGTAEDYSTNLWISKAGVVAGLHYDLTHNMYAQVSGCKRFLLVPPVEMAAKAKLFPRDHPNDRQSQLELTEVAEGLAPEARVQALVADIGPGDMLYLPPAFGHRVAAFTCDGTEFSMSLNTWSKSVVREVARITKAIESIPERFTKISKGSHGDAVRALGVYLRRVVTQLAPNRDFAGVIRHLVEQRYVAQDDFGYAMGCSDFNATLCPKPVVDLAAFEATNAELVAEVVADADAMVKVFRSGNVELDQGVIDILLDDFIERVAILVVSIPKACPYLLCVAEAV